MLKKAKLYFLLAVMVASTMVGLLGLPQTADAQSADLKGHESEELTGLTRDKIYQQLMYLCLEAYGSSSRAVKNFDDGMWVTSSNNIDSSKTTSNHSLLHQNSKWRAGYIIAPNGSGLLACGGKSNTEDGKQLIQGYMKATNYESKVSGTPYNDLNNLKKFHFICTLGFQPVGVDNPEDNITICVEAARDSPEQKYHLAQNKVTNVELQNEEKYLAYRYTLLHPNACNAKPLAITGSNDADATIERYSIHIVQTGGEYEVVDFDIPDPGKDVTPFPVSRDTKILCSDLPGLMEDTYEDYAHWLSLRPEDSPLDEDLIFISESNCRVDGIGWIVCPVVNFMASIVDSTYEILDNSLLRTAPVVIGDTNEGLYQSWKAMRDIANVLFVVVFLFIIFSQVTSFGIDNYGIKRLLPKLIVSAILVNLSFLICAIAVDASNILGSSLKELLQSRSGNIDITPGSWGDSKGWESWAAISTGILIGVGAAGGFAALGLLIPALFAALGSIIAVVLVLVLRQVLIILLIVISPLAFVALLLPNTENYFSRWRSTFMTMLLLYPIIAIIFGASSLASKIIMASSDQTMVQLMGALASVIPLAVTPVVMKFAGGVLNRFAGIVNDTDKGLLDRGRNRLTKAHENSAYMRGKKARDSLKTGRQNREFAEKYERGRKVAEKIAGGESIKEALNGGSAVETAKNADALRVYNAARGPGALAEAGVRQLSGQAEKLSDYPLMSGLSAVGQNLPGAKGRAGDLHDMSLYFQGEVEKSTAAALKDAISVFSKELAAAQAGGENQDSFLRERAAATTGLDREAVFHTAASLGRDGVMDDFKETYTDKTDQQAWQRAVSSNASSLINKAPHQVKGEDAAFNSASGEDIVKFSKHTIQKHMEHLSKLEVDARAAGSGSDEEIKYENAKKSFLNAMQNIKDTDLRGNFKTEIGDQIVESIVNAASTSAGSNLAADLSGVVNELRVHKGGLGPAGTPIGTTPPQPSHGPPVPWSMQTPQQRASRPDDV